MNIHISRTRPLALPAVALATALSLGSCASSTPPGAARLAAQRPVEERISWPGDYAPDKAAFFVHNQIDIQAEPARVWGILIYAADWPQWYAGASDIQLADPDKPLAADSVFSWRIMGLNLESGVREFEPPNRLAWESRMALIRSHHAWLLVPTETGTRVISDESFHGFLAYMQRAFQPRKLHRLHQAQLEELKRIAESEATQ